MLGKDLVSGVEIHPCARCGGVWFSRTELEHLAQSAGSLLGRLDLQHEPAEEPGLSVVLGSLRCPACRGALLEFQYFWAPGIPLDGCPTCRGVWVDDGEMERLESAATPQRRRSRQEGSSTPEIGTLEGRVWALRALIHGGYRTG